MRILNVTIIVLALVLTFIFGAHALEEKKQKGIYTEEDLAFVILKAEPQFVIRLKSNPSTGYSWFLRDYDEHFIKVIKHQFVSNDTKIPGAPGYEDWTFQLLDEAFVAPIQTQIRFIYARPWLHDDQGKMLTFRVATKMS